MNKNIYYLHKGAVVGALFYFAMLFLSVMVLDEGAMLLNINKYTEGWVETILLFYLTGFSIYDLITGGNKK